MKKIIMILKLLLVSSFVVINVLSIFNNAIDIKYLIEPFDVSGDLLELRRIAAEKLRNASNLAFINLFLITVYLIINVKWKKSSRLYSSTI